MNLNELNGNSEELEQKELDFIEEEIQTVDADISDLLEQGPITSPGINRIYFGAPGTGKSYGIQKFIRENGISEYDDKISHPNVFRVWL